jgi:hypothetical protein
VARFLTFVIAVTAAGLFYVYEEVAAVQIGYTIRKQQEAKVQALDRGRALKYNIASLKAPHNLERKLLAQRIELESPKRWQTLMVSEGARVKKASVMQTSAPASFLTKFFVGTAQAEAKESTPR